jgi:signal transduction histidine kinase/HAMP domain-containing protein
MTFTNVIHRLPLRWQLTWMLTTIAIAATIITAATVGSMATRRLNEQLRDKSIHYGRQLQKQLMPVLSFNDRLTAAEVFDSMMDDHDVAGLGVYRADGGLLEGRGMRPASLPSLDAPLTPDPNHIITLAAVKSREGKSGYLYVSLTNKSVRELEHRDAWFEVALAGVVALCAFLLAVPTSRRLARRIANIADATRRLAAGDRRELRLEDHSRDEIGALAHGFNVMASELNRLSLEREQLVASERDRLENLVAERTQALERSREMIRMVAESTQAIPFTLNVTDGTFPYIGAQGVTHFNISEDECAEPGALDRLLPRAQCSELRRQFDECGAGPFEFYANVETSAGFREMRWTGTCELSAADRYLRGLILDVTEVKRLARELAAAQKLESVGRLAAGVAHEINTPVQFVADNVAFLKSSMTDLAAVIRAYRDLRSVLDVGKHSGSDTSTRPDLLHASKAAEAAERAADLDYLIDNVPLAITDALGGLDRIAIIVRSMKEFAHPDQAEMSFADLNQAIKSTLVISRNEYKYLAEVETEFGDLPQVHCYLGEINQVVLNLLVNAAHSIGDAVKNTGRMGKISVRTRLDGPDVEIEISDTGVGIPEHARDKIFDPFFTTKEVGKGTGQGLAIARSVVVNKHGGTLRFETECGRGTTFFVRIPVGPSINAIAPSVRAA